MNSFGQKLKFSTFGESHGKAIGCLLDGVPAGLDIDEEFIQKELDRRKPGKSEFETQRKEEDKVEILSGVFEGKSTGTPIAMVIYNTDQKSNDYSNIKDVFRPGHADFTYFYKYGIRDYRGGGRSSARETAARVAAGAIAKLMLKELDIEVLSGICEVDGIKSLSYDYEAAKKSIIYALDASKEEEQKEAILRAKNEHDSVGGVSRVLIKGAPKGLGQPLYYKMDAILADAMMGINAVKAVEIGDGVLSASLKGSQNNDEIRADGFVTNHSGGILGGISNGEDIVMNVYFKPTPSIFKEQKTVTSKNEEVNFSLKGRHDPCVAIRGTIVCEAMAALVIADMLLLNMGSQMQRVVKYYK
ncbi:MAG: chorismate synthase [Sulfurimonas sp. RIFCSPHIGHO2_12_FULL_36_9]|uniref:chorismate synthase n=1 Tax=Sulfurimonas sp. RIFCSPLOWO2_12_36_12 TaxID=1802253 RepID=UPI0008C09299|nr:chorismate synthase [Sulfurimonas sp. RIFCSPLOWO2_12_36_12]OHD96933.1 MAG: chorismate synthase [Sulfurimonas sp. RIFCSPHIGHO2_12_FULL_36_9]OHD98310.1 MAG: chorismate synthase [Sulfurimonas sp. RIFCSPLOWO2_02_FULL_36_28]OHE00154.1 MAG: chorismate synthase [Sulfurimonas sp. RIFCSPLOWO2_12_36_12]OHE01810.1 MAG: chorismate synthase [Sulfurimonas sp. RIFCSPLOWO2_12_FULL_36_74]